MHGVSFQPICVAELEVSFLLNHVFVLRALSVSVFRVSRPFTFKEIIHMLEFKCPTELSLFCFFWFSFLCFSSCIPSGYLNLFLKTLYCVLGIGLCIVMEYLLWVLQYIHMTHHHGVLVSLFYYLEWSVETLLHFCFCPFTQLLPPFHFK